MFASFVTLLLLSACRHDTGLAQRAAEGDPIAQYEYGRRLLTGQKGEPRNPGLAVTFLRPAAEGGYAPAQALLAFCCERGLGTDVSAENARRWYAGAAEQGNLNACRALLQMELKAHRPEEAARCLQQLAERENPAAQLALGKLCLSGVLGENQMAQGVRYVRYAAMQGDREACLLMAACYREGLANLPREAALADGWEKNARDSY